MVASPFAVGKPDWLVLILWFVQVHRPVIFSGIRDLRYSLGWAWWSRIDGKPIYIIKIINLSRLWPCIFFSFATGFIHSEEIIELQVIAIKIVHPLPRLGLDAGHISSVGMRRVRLRFICVFGVRIPLGVTRWQVRGFRIVGIGILISHNSKEVRWQVRSELSLSRCSRWRIVSMNISGAIVFEVLPISSHIT